MTKPNEEKYGASKGTIVKENSNQTLEDSPELDTINNESIFISYVNKLPEREKGKISITVLGSINSLIMFLEVANSLLQISKSKRNRLVNVRTYNNNVLSGKITLSFYCLTTTDSIKHYYNDYNVLLKYRCTLPCIQTRGDSWKPL